MEGSGTNVAPFPFHYNQNILLNKPKQVRYNFVNVPPIMGGGLNSKYQRCVKVNASAWEIIQIKPHVGTRFGCDLHITPSTYHLGVKGDIDDSLYRQANEFKIEVSLLIFLNAKNIGHLSDGLSQIILREESGQMKESNDLYLINCLHSRPSRSHIPLHKISYEIFLCRLVPNMRSNV